VGKQDVGSYLGDVADRSLSIYDADYRSSRRHEIGVRRAKALKSFLHSTSFENASRQSDT